MSTISNENADALVAEHVLRRLGEGGQPPQHGIRLINVGNESYLDVLADEYLDDLLERGSAFKLVEGFFGAGKTHFLFCVRELAWERGYTCSLVELSPQECPYDDSRATYAATARNIAIAGPGPLDPPCAGIGQVLREALERRRGAALAELGDSDGADGWSDPDPKVLARVDLRLETWIVDLERAPCESTSYRRAVTAFLRALKDRDRAAEFALEAWLAGEPVPAGEVRSHGVFDAMSQKNGFLMLRSMTQMLTAVGYKGTVLLFDEVDRNLSFGARRNQIIGDNLRQVVDLCGRHQLPNTLFVYAVPPEFMRTVVPDYPALYQRLKSPAQLGVRNPRAVIIDLDDLDLPPTRLLSEIAEKICGVFETAHPDSIDVERQSRNGRLIAAACVHTQFDVNHRRLFVKTFVDFLERQRREGEVELSEDDAIDLVLDEYEGWNGR